VPIYRESARAFDLNWLVLASVHKHETGFSTHPTTYRGVNFAGCCAGPFQFNVTNGPPSTWDSHKRAYRAGARPSDYPHPQAPHPSVYDDFDAGMAAGSLLHTNGADRTLGQRTWDAVRAYNGAGPIAVAYADDVLTQARSWAQSTTPPSATTPTRPGSGFVWPVRGPISSPFCERRPWEACHPGIDIAVPTGTPILATDTGRVSVVQNTASSGGYGNFTCLQHTAGVSTCYAHQQRVLVRPGQLIVRGQQIGTSDCTGRCYGSHLHFEVRLDGRIVCPARYLDASPRSMCAPGLPGS
jgi:murein DD-endopeptidase MepM/ murein hydrolase activator NlpD